MVLPALGRGLVEQRIFDNQVDTVRQAADKIIKKAHEYAQAIIASSSAAMTSQQLQMINNAILLWQTFAVIYENEMDKTVEKTNQAVKERLAQFATIVETVIEGITGPKVQQILDQWRALAMAAPLMKDKPFVTAVSPVLVSANEKQESVIISCVGYFPGAGDLKLTPRLEIRGQTLTPINNIGTIDFAVPRAILFSKTDQPLMTIRYDVTFPYPKPGWLGGVLNKTYQSWMTLLPDSPGILSLEYTEVTEERETQEISGRFGQSSKKSGENSSIINRPHALTAPIGWSIVPGSSRLKIDHSIGKGNSWNKIADGPQSVIYHVSTHKQKHDRDSGGIVIELFATICKVNQVFTKKEELLNLTWGESFAIPPAKLRNWKVRFNGFDGSKKEYTGNVNDRFIQISSPGGTPVISVKPADAIPREVGAKVMNLQAKL